MAPVESSRDGGTEQALVKEAEKALQRAIVAVNDYADRMERGEPEPFRLAGRVLAESLREAVQALFRESQRLDRSLPGGGDTEDGADFDLLLATDEVGRLLARLRADRRAGPVPG